MTPAVGDAVATIIGGLVGGLVLGVAFAIAFIGALAFDISRESETGRPIIVAVGSLILSAASVLVGLVVAAGGLIGLVQALTT